MLLYDGRWKCDGCGKEWAFHEADPERPWDLDDPDDDDPGAHEIDNFPGMAGEVDLCERCVARAGVDMCDDTATVRAAADALRRMNARQWPQWQQGTPEPVGAMSDALWIVAAQVLRDGGVPYRPVPMREELDRRRALGGTASMWTYVHSVVEDYTP